ncbi:MAG TPA: phage exclusion protein Lit family protein [Phenylobacterium sp.]
MTDAERLMAPLIPAISAAPYAIAPERAEELNDDVFGGVPWDLFFTAGPANFFARPQAKELEARFAAVLSLWAASRAALQLGEAMMRATRAKEPSVEVVPDGPVDEAFRLVEVAKTLIRSPSAAWPADLPAPPPRSSWGGHDWHVQQLFLGATAWALHHEIAHVHLRHEEVTIDAVRRQQEHEADVWATRWILARAGTGRKREFRAYSAATGLAWLGLIDDVRRGSTTHPHAAQRLGACAESFGLGARSPALELAAYTLKAFFNPTEAVPATDTPAEAFEDALFRYARQPR